MNKEHLERIANELLLVASEIEKEAAEKTIFKCGSCEHTASLNDINTSRKEACSHIEGKTIVASEISVNDKIRCASCEEGVMVYASSPESDSFYMDSEASEDVVADYDAVEAAAQNKKDGAPSEEVPEDTAQACDKDPKTSEEPSDTKQMLLKKASEFGLRADLVSKYLV
jgi:hypothetical protein